jgi:hypothetical protein
LWFTLLVVREGYAPTYIKKIDPAAGPVLGTLPVRPPITEASYALRGRVVNSSGSPIADAVISPDELSWNTPKGPTGGGGAIKGLDLVAISNEKGEFEVGFDKPGIKMTVTVEARGMAPKRFRDLGMGAQRHDLQVKEGATVAGRLMHNGKPLANVQMGLCGQSRLMGEFFSEVRIGTDAQGRFLFPNVPVPGKWYVYPKMESIVALGSAQPGRISTEDDGEIVKVEEIVLRPGRRVRGQVILTDGKPIAEGMTIGVFADMAWDGQTIPLGADGRFEFRNLPTDDFSITPAVKGYRLSRKNPNLSWSLEGFIDSDIDDLVILMEPGKEDFEGLSGGKFRGKPFVSAQTPGN